MTKMNVMMRMKMVFTAKDVERTKVVEKGGKVSEIIVDVHGMLKAEAQKFLHNLIALIRGTYKLTVIHGFNRGTAIKQMLRETKISDRVTELQGVGCNPGVTIMMIA